MSNKKKGDVVVNQDTVIKGRIRNCGSIEIYGYVDGDLVADTLVVRPGGRFYGVAKTSSADVSGALQGEIAVRDLISIRKTGSVKGQIRYGRISVEDGGNLTADMRNVPPELFGDFETTVERGGKTRLTTFDINAVDPDDSAENLTFAVSNAKNGFVALVNKSREAVQNFTQADLEAGGVIFVHDGANGKSASFDVVVRDSKGATSGAPASVRIAVR